MKLALTFDDGPADWTEPILNVLAAYDAHATFFVCGANIPGRIPTLDKVVEAGHTLGNHTTNHPSLLGMTEEQVAYELAETALMLEALYGQTPDVWRAPFLHTPTPMPAGITHLGCTIIPGDWLDPDPERIADHVVREAHDGGVVLLHDGRFPGQPPHSAGGSLDSREQTVKAVALMLPALTAAGYTFS